MRQHITSPVIKTKEGIYVSSNLSMTGQDTISRVKKYNRCWGQTAFAAFTYHEMRTCTEEEIKISSDLWLKYSFSGCTDRITTLTSHICVLPWRPELNKVCSLVCAVTLVFLSGWVQCRLHLQVSWTDITSPPSTKNDPARIV